MSRHLHGNFLSLIASLGFAVLLSACASGPRSAALDKDVKKVVIVSMLEENAPVIHVGLTVFNNDRTTVPQHGELNRLASSVVEQRLHAARPEWMIVAMKPDEALAKKNNGSVSWSGFTGNVKGDLQRIARDNDADFIFAVVDTTRENSSGRGVGIWLRAIRKESLGSALVHAHVLLVLVDKSGNEVTNRSGSDGSVPASDLGLNYDLSSLKDSQVEARVSVAMRTQLSKALSEAAQSMGY
jgi:hypothetical protein